MPTAAPVSSLELAADGNTLTLAAGKNVSFLDPVTYVFFLVSCFCGLFLCASIGHCVCVLFYLRACAYVLMCLCCSYAQLPCMCSKTYFSHLLRRAASRCESRSRCRPMSTGPACTRPALALLWVSVLHARTHLHLHTTHKRAHPSGGRQINVFYDY